ncbi:MAG: hypothetical protein ACUVRS_05910 [Armatimonadota bacterium]
MLDRELADPQSTAIQVITEILKNTGGIKNATPEAVVDYLIEPVDNST